MEIAVCRRADETGVSIYRHDYAPGMPAGQKTKKISCSTWGQEPSSRQKIVLKTFLFSSSSQLSWSQFGTAPPKSVETTISGTDINWYKLAVDRVHPEQRIALRKSCNSPVEQLHSRARASLSPPSQQSPPAMRAQPWVWRHVDGFNRFASCASQEAATAWACPPSPCQWRTGCKGTTNGNKDNENNWGGRRGRGD